MNGRRALTALAILAGACFAMTGVETTSAGAMIVTVTKTEDTADGTCDNDCSLREAIIAANTIPNVGAVDIPAGTYVLTIPGYNEDAGATGDLDITDSVNLYGDQAGGTTIDGGIERAIDNLAPSLVINDLTLTNGALDVLWNRPGRSLTLTNTTIRDKVSTSGYAALTNHGHATLEEVTIADNVGSGGISTSTAGAEQAVLIIEDSTISGNITEIDGGGLRGSGGTITITNSTFSGNFAARNGGAISIDGATLSLLNVTITSNTSDADTNGTGDGGGMYVYGSGSTTQNTIIAGNVDPGAEAPDCATDNGALTSLGHNVFIDTSGCTLDGSGTGDITADPLLLPLADNGGPTLTHLPDTDSPAINSGDDVACPDSDQRGATRPIARCDIGAVETSLKAGQSLWGDNQCDGDVDAVDALQALRVTAGLSPFQEAGCHIMGDDVMVDGNDISFGDVTCSGLIDSVDGLALLRFVAGLPPLQQIEPCPDVGAIVIATSAQ